MPYYFWYSIYAIYKYCNDRKKPNYYLVWQDDKLTFQKTSLLQLHSEWNNPLNKLRHGILAWLIIRVLNRIKMGYNKNISITVSDQEVWDDDMGTKLLKQQPVDRLLDWKKHSSSLYIELWGAWWRRQKHQLYEKVNIHIRPDDICYRHCFRLCLVWMAPQWSLTMTDAVCVCFSV